MKPIFKAVLPFLVICLISLLLLFNSRPSNKVSDSETNSIPIVFVQDIQIAHAK